MYGTCRMKLVGVGNFFVPFVLMIRTLRVRKLKGIDFCSVSSVCSESGRVVTCEEPRDYFQRFWSSLSDIISVCWDSVCCLSSQFLLLIFLRKPFK